MFFSKLILLMEPLNLSCFKTLYIFVSSFRFSLTKTHSKIVFPFQAVCNIIMFDHAIQ